MGAIGKPRATSKDVARHAGVSQSAVSLVLSGKGAGRVAPAKADAIRASARALGYRPNAAARTLKTGSARAVGLVVPDVEHPFFGQVLRGAQLAALEGGQAVVLVDAARDEAWQQESYALLQDAGAVDGFLWFATTPPHELSDDVPIVVVESEVPGLTSVRFDIEDGFRMLGAHLRELGHTQVAHLAADVDQQTFTHRARGLEAGLGHAVVASARARLRIDLARAAARPLLEADDRPTAIVADDDLLAAGVVLAARELGLRVPQDVSIAGFDDLDLAQVTDPPLTTVRLDGADLGARAFRALAELLAGETPPERQVLGVELVVRGSTGPPPVAQGSRERPT